MVDYESFEIHVDDRERKIIPFFDICENPKNMTIIQKRLTVGDYAYVYQGKILAIIERKSWVDLAHSITDGRKENIDKMIEVRDKTDCKLIYLMEGSVFRQPKTKISRIPFKALRSHLDHLSIRDGVIIIYSKDYNNSAERIIDFAENMCTLPMIIQIGGKQHASEVVLLTLHRAKSEKAIMSLIWKSIVGVTSTNYDSLCEKYKLKDLILQKIDNKTLGLIKYPSGHCLGESKAKKILMSAVDKHTWKKMLSKIPGITYSTSIKIIDKYGLNDIILGNVTIVQLANIQKTEKRKIGQAIACKIMHFLLDQNT